MVCHYRQQSAGTVFVDGAKDNEPGAGDDEEVDGVSVSKEVDGDGCERLDNSSRKSPTKRPRKKKPQVDPSDIFESETKRLEKGKGVTAASMHQDLTVVLDMRKRDKKMTGVAQDA